MPTYHPDRPENCPFANTMPHSGKIYRGIRRATIAPIDFLSHAERPQAQCDRSDCQAWGLSVWVDLEDVLFARGASSFIRDRYIAEGEVNNNDGCILRTPSNIQNNHFTYWKDVAADFVSRFHVILEPVGE